uniref:VCBS repeat-containing protein n=1 Tax=Algoriphagus sp. TaxID=1872435 RepID=UPI0040475201
MKRFLILLFLAIAGCSEDSDPVTPPPTPIVKYTLTVTAGEGGSVNSSGGQYDKGTTVSVSASPNKYFKFVKWSNGSAENPIIININENINLEAEFVLQNFEYEFDYSQFSPPSLDFSPEGLGYIETNDKHYLFIPFANLSGNETDYLRIFEFDDNSNKLIDITNTIFNVLPEVGFSKSPLIIEDFNDDGFLDFFLVDHGQENELINGRWEGALLKFYFGSANGFIRQNFPGITDKKLFYHHADAADYDLDGDIDIISQRWESQTEQVPSGNTVSIFRNNEGSFEIITLEGPLDSVGSVLFSNIDDDDYLEVLCATYRSDEGTLWAWDPLDGSTSIINDQMGPHQIHDMVEIKNSIGSRILLFPEDYKGNNTPILSSVDKGGSIVQSTDFPDFQGRDIIIDDFNNDGLEDIFMFFGNDGEWLGDSSYGVLSNSFFLNNGDNTFSNPNKVIDYFGKDYSDYVSNLFFPLKNGEDGYLFMRFENVYPFPNKSEMLIFKTIE